jgi:hypothetical protein
MMTNKIYLNGVEFNNKYLVFDEFTINLDNHHCNINYAVITFDSCVNFDKITCEYSVFKDTFVHYQLAKVFPFQYMKNFDTDTETERLLKFILHNKNIIFLPLFIGNTIREYLLKINGLDITNLRVYVNYSQKKNKLNKLNYYPQLITTYDFRTEFTKYVNVNRISDIITTFYIILHCKKKFKYIYKLIRNIIVEIGGMPIINIPIDFLYFYLKTNINNLWTENNNVHTLTLPINLTSMFNFYIINRSLQYHSIRIKVETGTADDIISYCKSNICRFEFNNNIIIPNELWKMVGLTLKINDLVNLKRVCKQMHLLLEESLLKKIITHKKKLNNVITTYEILNDDLFKDNELRKMFTQKTQFVCFTNVLCFNKQNFIIDNKKNNIGIIDYQTYLPIKYICYDIKKSTHKILQTTHAINLKKIFKACPNSLKFPIDHIPIKTEYFEEFSCELINKTSIIFNENIDDVDIDIYVYVQQNGTYASGMFGVSNI